MEAMDSLFDFYQDVYPDRPGTKSEIDTSVAAAESMAAKASTLRAKVLELLRVNALTADECAAHLGEDILSIRPRLSELRAKNQIKDTGTRRKNKSGHKAAVWSAIG